MTRPLTLRSRTPRRTSSRRSNCCDEYAPDRRGAEGGAAHQSGRGAGQRRREGGRRARRCKPSRRRGRTGHRSSSDGRSRCSPNQCPPIMSYPDQVATLLDEAQHVLGDDHRALRARLMALEAFKYSAYQLQGRDGRALADRAVALARDAGDAPTLTAALFARAVSLESTARHDRAARARRGARRLRPGGGWERGHGDHARPASPRPGAAGGRRRRVAQRDDRRARAYGRTASMAPRPRLRRAVARHASVAGRTIRRRPRRLGRHATPRTGLPGGGGNSRAAVVLPGA